MKAYLEIDRIRRECPCVTGWNKLLRTLRGRQVTSLVEILLSNGHHDALWAVQALPRDMVNSLAASILSQLESGPMSDTARLWVNDILARSRAGQLDLVRECTGWSNEVECAVNCLQTMTSTRDEEAAIYVHNAVIDLCRARDCNDYTIRDAVMEIFQRWEDSFP